MNAAESRRVRLSGVALTTAGIVPPAAAQGAAAGLSAAERATRQPGFPCKGRVSRGAAEDCLIVQALWPKDLCPRSAHSAMTRLWSE